MNFWRNVAEFLALKRNTTLLLVALVLAGTGEKLWLGFAPKYLQVLGAGVFIVGLSWQGACCWVGRRWASKPSYP